MDNSNLKESQSTVITQFEVGDKVNWNGTTGNLSPGH